jgi:hypothetical protein
MGFGSGIRDPGSGKTYSGSQIPDPRSRGLKGTGSRIRNTAFFPFGLLWQVDLQKKMENSDEIRFIVEDETFVSSKARLVTASDYFKALLQGNFQAMPWIRNRSDPELFGSVVDLDPDWIRI